MPHRPAFLKALARMNSKPSNPSTTPSFQPPFKDRPSLPTIKVTTTSSATSPNSTSNSPIIHNSPFPPDSPIQPGYSPLTPPISPLTPPASPPTPPLSTQSLPFFSPTTTPEPNPTYHLSNRYLRTLVLLLTPQLMTTASNYLADQGYGTGTSGTVMEADEIDFLRNLDDFLCLLDPRYDGGSSSTAANVNTGKRHWPAGLELRSKYLDRVTRELDAERWFMLEEWVEGRFGGKVRLGAYVGVVDGFLGVLEGRGEGDVEAKDC